jgi:hypothetical protein
MTTSLRALLPLIAALCLLLVGCGSDDTPIEPEPTGDVTPVPDPQPEPAAPGDVVGIGTVDQAEAARGQQVSVEGLARNAKLGAVVVSDALLVYCLDAEGGAWPDEWNGKKVVATGTLEFTEEFVAPTDEHGAVSAGTDGGVYVLRSSTRSLLEQ